LSKSCYSENAVQGSYVVLYHKNVTNFRNLRIEPMTVRDKAVSLYGSLAL